MLPLRLLVITCFQIRHLHVRWVTNQNWSDVICDGSDWSLLFWIELHFLTRELQTTVNLCFWHNKPAQLADILLLTWTYSWSLYHYWHTSSSYMNLFIALYHYWHTGMQRSTFCHFCTCILSLLCALAGTSASVGSSSVNEYNWSHSLHKVTPHDLNQKNPLLWV